MSVTYFILFNRDTGAIKRNASHTKGNSFHNESGKEWNKGHEEGVGKKKRGSTRDRQCSKQNKGTNYFEFLIMVF